MPTHYEILMLPRDADQPAIKAAYKKLALQFHPDKHPNAGNTMTAVMQAVNQAYACLSDQSRKSAYDMSLPARRTVEQQQQQQQQQTTEPDEEVQESKVTPNSFCGDYYAGKCWGMGCTKVHCEPEEFWSFVEDGILSAGVIRQLKRFV